MSGHLKARLTLGLVGGLHGTEVAHLLLTQQPRVQFPALPKKFKIFF